MKLNVILLGGFSLLASCDRHEPTQSAASASNAGQLELDRKAYRLIAQAEAAVSEEDSARSIGAMASNLAGLAEMSGDEVRAAQQEASAESDLARAEEARRKVVDLSLQLGHLRESGAATEEIDRFFGRLKLREEIATMQVAQVSSGDERAAATKLQKAKDELQRQRSEWYKKGLYLK